MSHGMNVLSDPLSIYATFKSTATYNLFVRSPARWRQILPLATSTWVAVGGTWKTHSWHRSAGDLVAWTTIDCSNYLFLRDEYQTRITDGQRLRLHPKPRADALQCLAKHPAASWTMCYPPLCAVWLRASDVQSVARQGAGPRTTNCSC